MTPYTVMMFAGGLFLLAGRFTRNKSVWGPLCLLTLVFAGWSLFESSAWVDSSELKTPSPTLLDDNKPGAASGTSGIEPNWVVRDSFSVVIQWACLATAVLLTLAALDTHGRSNNSAEHFGLLLLSLAGLMLAAVAGDLIVMFLAVELAAVPIYLLLFLAGNDLGSREAAAKYFLLSLLSSALLLYGFSLIFGLTGTTNLAAIRGVLSASYTPIEPNLAIGAGSRLGIVALVLIFAGLGFRMAIAPFHFGIPETLQGTTVWNACLLAIVPKAVAFVVLARVLTGSLAGFGSTGQLVAMIVAAVTMTIGNLNALFETNIRRILAYTTIAHGGYVLMGVAVGFWDAQHPGLSLQAGASLPGGIQAALFFLCGYMVAIVGLFAVLAYLDRPQRQITYVEELAGISRSEPLAAVCAGVCLLSLAGVPPFPGFWGRMFLLSATLSVQVEPVGSAVSGPHPGFLLLTAVAIVNLAMTAVVCLRLVSVLFLQRQVSRPRPAGGQPALAAALLAALMTIGIGLLPGPIVGHLGDVQARKDPVGRQPKSNIGETAGFADNLPETARRVRFTQK